MPAQPAINMSWTPSLELHSRESLKGRILGYIYTARIMPFIIHRHQTVLDVIFH